MVNSSTDWWRVVLGEYPTGVTLIASTDSRGAPIGMIVGTFNAVSQDPPLIGFMPMNSSRTFPAIVENGRFLASVLGSAHEGLSRDFLARPETRFVSGEWETTKSGLLRLSDALAWFEGTIEHVYPAGDHQIVVAAVSEFGVGDGTGGFPLLFLRGGYGSFAVPGSRADLHEFRDRLDHADQMVDALNVLARTYDVDCVLCTVAGDSVVLLASSAGVTDQRRMSFPFVAPLGEVLAAWSTAERHKAWIENSRHILGAVDRPALAAMLDRVRKRGYAVSRGSVLAERFYELVSHHGGGRSALASIWKEQNDELAEFEQDPDSHATVSSVHVPVFGADGTAVMELVVSGFDPMAGRARFDEILDATRETTAWLSALTEEPGGADPEARA